MSLKNILNQVDIDPSFKNVMLKWPNHILKCADHVAVWCFLNLNLVFLDFHSLNLVGVIKPNGLCRLLNAYDIMEI
jgi:hypothetical protein